MADFIPPTKEELKQRYNITNDDFEILTTRPDDLTIQQKGFLIKLGEVFTATEWMWRSWKGRIIAIIVICPTAYGIYSFWQPVAIYSYKQASAFIDYAAPDEKREWVAVYPENTELPDSIELPSCGDMPANTGLYPASISGTGTYS